MTENSRTWPFADPPNVATLTTVNILERRSPILLVTHDAEDGMWQVLCGTTNDPKDGRVVSLSEMYKQDPTIGELADLPLGWRAWRTSPTGPWSRVPNPRQGDEPG